MTLLIQILSGTTISVDTALLIAAVSCSLFSRCCIYVFMANKLK